MNATIQQLGKAILSAIEAHFNGKLRTVTMDRLEAASPIRTPAAVLVIEDGGKGESLGDGRFPFNLQFTVFCLLSTRTQIESEGVYVSLECAAFAASVLQLAEDNRWGFDNVGLPDIPENSGAMGRAEFKPGSDGYESWYATWDQVLYMGTSAWDADGVLPGEVRLGLEPAIGAGHEEDYIRVDDEGTQ